MATESANDLHVAIFLVSVRETRRGEAFAKWIQAALAERPGVHLTLLDLRDWPLPAYAHAQTTPSAEKNYPPDSLPGRWRDQIAAQDAFVVVTPEYNHGYPGQLKNALDHLYVPWNFKPVGFLSYGGFASGARAVEQLRQIAVELRMVPVRDEVNISLVDLQADANGWPTDPLPAKRAKAMLDDVLWWARVCREGRTRQPR